MTRSTLKEEFARRVPTLAIDLVPSGSPEVVRVRVSPDWRRVRSIDAILTLRRRGLKMLQAKRAIEAAMDHGDVVVTVPVVEDVGVLTRELDEAGFGMEVLTPAPTI